MFISRRNFLQQSALAATGSMLIPGFLKALEPMCLKTDRKLVIIQLSGGNDSLNTIIPFRDDNYYRMRPNLHIPDNEVLGLDQELGFHPALASLRSYYDQGLLSVVNSVGYPNPDRSHFRSMEIWQTGADADQYLESGWLGRYLDASCPAEGGNHFGVEIGDTLSQSMKGERIKGLAMQNPERLYKALHSQLLNEISVMPDKSEVRTEPALHYLYKTLAESKSSSEYIFENFRIHRSFASYPSTRFAAQLRTVAQMIMSNLETQVYYLSMSGFDTHVRQKTQHDRLLRTYAEGVDAFLADLKEGGMLDRVLVMTFSEFGRRVEENAGGGTDHGTAGNVFLMGGSLKQPGFINEGPDLSRLSEGDLIHKVDFRSIYATIIDKWMQSDSQQILGKSYDYLGFV